MAALTVRLPDEKHLRLKALAKSRGTPLNRLIEEMTTVMLVEFDAETRFRLRVAQGAGKVARGLEILDELDAHFAKHPVTEDAGGEGKSLEMRSA